MFIFYSTRPKKNHLLFIYNISIVNSRLVNYYVQVYHYLVPTSELSFVSQQHDSFLKNAKYLRRHASSLVISQHSNNWEKIGVLSPERSTSVLNMYIHVGRQIVLNMSMIQTFIQKRTVFWVMNHSLMEIICGIINSIVVITKICCFQSLGRKQMS